MSRNRRGLCRLRQEVAIVPGVLQPCGRVKNVSAIEHDGLPSRPMEGRPGMSLLMAIFTRTHDPQSAGWAVRAITSASIFTPRHGSDC